MVVMERMKAMASYGSAICLQEMRGLGIVALHCLQQWEGSGKVGIYHGGIEDLLCNIHLLLTGE